MNRRYIGVFCSANELPVKYTKPAQKVASLMIENGYHLVWGGSDTGLMKLMASAVQEGGGRIVGISMDRLKHIARVDADEMIFAKDLGERKDMMLERSDALVVLVGGIGTIDEVTHMLELKKHNMHDKPIVVLNTDNFYDGFRQQLQKMCDEGLIKMPLAEIIYFAQTPEDAIGYISRRLK